jgi:hypothetical protein
MPAPPVPLPPLVALPALPPVTELPALPPLADNTPPVVVLVPPVVLLAPPLPPVELVTPPLAALEPPVLVVPPVPSVEGSDEHAPVDKKSALTEMRCFEFKTCLRALTAKSETSRRGN